jgi:hypothetical protein
MLQFGIKENKKSRVRSRKGGKGGILLLRKSILLLFRARAGFTK